jgi:adenine-specific DNA-methyltransferase
MPLTTWGKPSHNAEVYGTEILKSLLGDKRFPFPKSLYAVEDCLRFFVGDKRDATVLDFFSGSGTTAHAILRLNKQDNGMRRCISVTNNEVSDEEQKALNKKGLRAGDDGWEEFGICEYVTKPRIRAAISGVTPKGNFVNGDYKFADEFPMSQGFHENAEFFTLTYETPIAISHNLAFSRIASLLWLRAGARGRRIDELPPEGWDIADTYGVLSDLDKTKEFCKQAMKNEYILMAFIVTNDDRRFQSVVRSLPKNVEAVRLYESYLNNFQFTNGE